MLKRWIVLLAVLMLIMPAGALAHSAVIDNGSDPARSLNLRSQPGKDAPAVGKFVSGTQLEVIADAGNGWSQVRIGGARGSVTGYMMTDYLKDSSAVDARERRQVISPYGTQSVVLRDRPSNSYDAVAMLMVGETVTVIGVSGNFCFVQTGDSSVGCLLGSELK